MLLRRAGAGASRLPKTLGIVLAGALPAARDIVAGARAAGSSNLPVAALNVPSILGSGAASLRECLRKRFCSDRFAYRWWRGSLSLTRRALGPGVVLRVIVTLPDNFRCGGSVMARRVSHEEHVVGIYFRCSCITGPRSGQMSTPVTAVSRNIQITGQPVQPCYTTK
jgi:hypothetical protein